MGEETTKTIRTEIPKGYEIDKEKSTFENIVFKRKEISTISEYPEDIFDALKINNRFLGKDKVHYITNAGRIVGRNFRCTSVLDGNEFSTQERAEQLLQLGKLLEIRDAYNHIKGYTREQLQDSFHKNMSDYWSIKCSNKSIFVYKTKYDDIKAPIFMFATRPLAESFLVNFESKLKVIKEFL